MQKLLNCMRKLLWLDPSSMSGGGRWNEIVSGLRLPVVVAPMFLVSGPRLVVASGLHGLIGSFPTAYPRTLEELERWFQQIELGLAQQPAGPAPVGLPTALPCMRRECWAPISLTSVRASSPRRKATQSLSISK